ncbi:MAG: GerMN domain-containing protein [Desulfuromonadaceae bacterium]|nr:GerMN domain-containing protein [Desulfuromonadaceae bacterium]MDD2856878.1 GerMN domain-containing protein [Desulfuromonadaceae bacterium]
MTVPVRKKKSINVVIPFLVILTIFSILIWQKYRSTQELSASPEIKQTDGRRQIALYFANNDQQLSKEVRNIEPCNDPDTCLKRILEELLNGPISQLNAAIPEGTVIDSVSIKGGLATIEINVNFYEALAAGSSAEMLAVYSIVNTTAFNFPNIQRVKLNVGGNPMTVLRHLDLSEPLSPDYSLEQGYTQNPGEKIK